jgi:hypothetical protein
MGVDHDITLASKFSPIEGVDRDEIVALVVSSFEVHERDSHVHI